MKKILTFALSLLMMLGMALTLTSCLDQIFTMPDLPKSEEPGPEEPGPEDPGPEDPGPKDPDTGVIVLVYDKKATIDGEFDGSFKLGDTIALPKATKPWETFAGWYADAEYTTRVSNNYKPEKGGTIKLYAKFLTQIDFEYDFDGGVATNGGRYTTSFAPGYDLITLPELKKEGYIFEGWYFDKNFTREATLEILETITYSARLYAKWAEDAISGYIIYTDGDRDLNWVQYAYDYEMAIDYIPANKTGYTFEGWYFDEELTQPAISIGADARGNIRVYAKYTKSSAYVFYMDGDTLLKRVAYSYGNTINLGYKPQEKPCYRFDGWYFDEAFENPASQLSPETTGDVTVYAKFTRIGAYVIYMSEGTEVGREEYRYGTEKALDFTPPEIENYEFSHWCTDPAIGTAIAFVSADTTGDVTVYAKYNKIGAYIIYMDGERELARVPYLYGTEKAVDLVPDEKINYEFEAWYLDSEFKTQAVTVSASETSDVLVYAKFNKIGAYIIYMDGARELARISYRYGTETPIGYTPDEKPCYGFMGWYLDPEFTATAVSVSASETEDVTVYAKYKKTGAYIIYMYKDSELKREVYDYGRVTELVYIPEVELCYSFVGWYRDADLTDAISSIPADMMADITLYAKSEKTGGMLTYSDGDTVIHLSSYTYGAKTYLTYLPDAANGRVFAGWFYDKELTMPAIMIPESESEDVTVYAKFARGSLAPDDKQSFNSAILSSENGSMVDYHHRETEDGSRYVEYNWSSSADNYGFTIKPPLATEDGNQYALWHLIATDKTGNSFYDKYGVMDKNAKNYSYKYSIELGKVEDKAFVPLKLLGSVLIATQTDPEADYAEVLLGGHVIARITEGTLTEVTVDVDLSRFNTSNISSCTVTLSAPKYDGSGIASVVTTVSANSFAFLHDAIIGNGDACAWPAAVMIGKYDIKTADANAILDPGGDIVLRYTTGEEIMLPEIYGDAATFAGWYLDAGFTQRITSLPAGMAGLITLYPKYNEEPDDGPGVTPAELPVIESFTGTESNKNSIKYGDYLKANGGFITLSIPLSNNLANGEISFGGQYGKTVPIAKVQGGRVYPVLENTYTESGVTTVFANTSVATLGKEGSLDIVLNFVTASNGAISEVVVYYVRNGHLKDSVHLEYWPYDVTFPFNFTTYRMFGTPAITDAATVYDGNRFPTLATPPEAPKAPTEGTQGTVDFTKPVDHFTGTDSDRGVIKYADILNEGGQFISMYIGLGGAPSKGTYAYLEGWTGTVHAFGYFSKDGFHPVTEVKDPDQAPAYAEEPIALFENNESVEIVFYIGVEEGKFTGRAIIYYFVGGELKASVTSKSFNTDLPYEFCFNQPSWHLWHGFVSGTHETSVFAGNLYPAVALAPEVIANITYNTNEGTINDSGYSEKVYSGDDIILPADVTKYAFNFAGWYTDEACTVSAVASELSGEVTLYAKWDAKTPDVSITYNANGGTVNDEEGSYSTVVYDGAEVTLPANVTKAGHRFLGWYTDEACTVPAVASELSGEITLFAKWEEAEPVLVITYAANGGVINDARYSTAVYEGEAVLLPSNVKKNGYVFAGWYTDEACTVPAVASELSGTATLYAKWDVVEPAELELIESFGPTTWESNRGTYSYGNKLIENGGFFTFTFSPVSSGALELYIAGQLNDSKCEYILKIDADGNIYPVTASDTYSDTPIAKLKDTIDIVFDFNLNESNRVTDEITVYYFVGGELKATASLTHYAGKSVTDYFNFTWYCMFHFTAAPNTYTASAYAGNKYPITISGAETPENPDGGETPDPENPEGGETPDPENPEGGETPDPENPEGGETPDPENPDVAANIIYKVDSETVHTQEYTYGEETAITYIPDAIAGKLFAGWYLDEAFATPATVITADTTNDVQVYAKFVDNIPLYSDANQSLNGILDAIESESLTRTEGTIDGKSYTEYTITEKITNEYEPVLDGETLGAKVMALKNAGIENPVIKVTLQLGTVADTAVLPLYIYERGGWAKCIMYITSKNVIMCNSFSNTKTVATLSDTELTDVTFYIDCSGITEENYTSASEITLNGFAYYNGERVDLTFPVKPGANTMLRYSFSTVAASSYPAAIRIGETSVEFCNGDYLA